MFEGYSDIVSVAELCKMLKIGRNAAYRLIRDKEIKCIRIGRVIKIPKKSIIKYICG